MARVRGPGAAARQVAAFLAGRATSVSPLVPVVAGPPLRWISPNAVTPGGAPPPRGRFILRSAEFRHLARLTASQDGHVLTRSRPTRLIPGRPVHLRATWLAKVDPAGGPVHVTAG